MGQANVAERQSLALCLGAAAAAARVAPGDVLPCRRGKGALCRARHLTFYLAHVTGCLPQRVLARLSGRDPASIRYACGRIEDRRDDPSFDLAVGLLEQVISRAHRALGADDRPG